MSAYLAECTPRSIRVWTADDRPVLVATMRRADLGGPDEVLRAHGWHRVGPWATAEDVPAGHQLAAVVPDSTTLPAGAR